MLCARWGGQRHGSGNGGSLGPDASPGGPGPAAAGIGGGIAGGDLLLGATPGPRSARAPAAQAGPAGGFAIGGRRSVQARRTNEPPTIDGRLDDAVWRDAVLITDFTQTNPIEGAPPTERTEAWIAYDADHLYFAFYAHYTDPSQLRANRADRDGFWRDDWSAVMFYPFLDQQRAYRFSVNAYGIQGDAIIRGGRSMRGPPGGGGETGRIRTEKGTFYGAFQNDGQDPMPTTFKRPPLPPGVEAGGHGGSHGYLMCEFVEAILLDRMPLVDVAQSLNMTVSGIVAHESALKDGELLKIPQYSL